MKYLKVDLWHEDSQTNADGHLRSGALSLVFVPSQHVHCKLNIFRIQFQGFGHHGLHGAHSPRGPLGPPGSHGGCVYRPGDPIHGGKLLTHIYY